MSDEAQDVTNVRVEAPIAHEVGGERVYGNRVVYLEAEAPLPEEIPITLSVEVERREVKSVRALAGSPA